MEKEEKEEGEKSIELWFSFFPPSFSFIEVAQEVICSRKYGKKRKPFNTLTFFLPLFSFRLMTLYIEREEKDEMEREGRMDWNPVTGWKEERERIAPWIISQSLSITISRVGKSVSSKHELTQLHSFSLYSPSTSSFLLLFLLPSLFTLWIIYRQRNTFSNSFLVSTNNLLTREN